MLRTSVAVLTLVAAIPASAGSLAPPAGPVAPTMKDLVEVEPRVAINAANTPGDAGNTFIISQPGSYYLAGNVLGEVSKNGILVTSPNVMIDLNGFAMIGVVDSLDAVTASPVTTPMISVRNGQIREWDEGGITLPGEHSLVSGIVLHDIRFSGVTLGPRGIVSGCVIDTVGSNGISAGINSLVSDCTIATVAAFDGIFAGNGSSVTNCSVTGAGRHGISTGEDVSVEGCFVESSDENGINASVGSRIAACRVVSNMQIGILALDNSRVEDNVVVGNGLEGIAINSFTVVRGNHVNSNGFIPGGSPGISVHTTGNTIQSNTVSSNDGPGIVLTALSFRNLYLSNTLSENNGGGAQISDFGAGNVDGAAIDGALTNILY